MDTYRPDTLFRESISKHRQIRRHLGRSVRRSGLLDERGRITRENYDAWFSDFCNRHVVHVAGTPEAAEQARQKTLKISKRRAQN